ncbi:MAG: S8 family serine peptidase, partial [Bacteroidota bacterium]
TGSGLAIEFDFIIDLPIFAFNSNGQNQDTGEPLPDNLEELGVKAPPSEVFGPDCAIFSPPREGIADGGPLVVIIDSGVDTSIANRPLFRPFAEAELNLCESFMVGPFGYDFLNGDAQPADDLGHGTGVAGALLSTYPSGKELRLQHYKFVGPKGGTYFGAICAMHTAVAAEASLLNLSWGIRTDTLPNALALALQACEEANIIVVTSAGNDSLDITTAPNWPASASSTFSNIVAVGAYDYVPSTDDPERMAFSNFGAAAVELVAPFGLEVPKLGGGLHEQVGTSISAPQLTAHLAAVRESNPDISLEDALDVLRNDGLLRRAATLNGAEVNNQQYLELNCKLSL